jgi:hypothetical protein
LVLIKKREAVPVPPEHLETVAAFVAEDEEMAGEWIFVAEKIANDGEETVEAAAHVGGLSGDEHAGGGRQS